MAHATGVMCTFITLFSRLLCAAALGASLAASAAAPAANGVFLVASRDLMDPNFRETVVLVTQPHEGGPFGVVINRPLGRRLAEILPEYETLKSRQDVVHYGGPVAPAALVFLVRSAAPIAGATRVLEDTWILNHPDAVDTLLKQPDSISHWRAYAGYAGWGPGQLQHELKRGGWHVLPADAETVFDRDPAAIWPELSARAAIRRTSAKP